VVLVVGKPIVIVVVVIVISIIDFIGRSGCEQGCIEGRGVLGRVVIAATIPKFASLVPVLAQNLLDAR
jgi:hypothetical protein